MLTEGMYVADRYEIIGKIGAGGMSDVYKAKDLTLGRFVAIKILKPEFSEDINFVTKFRTEAQSAAGLQHPNIVNIYDVGSENGMHFIVMEYVEGITLKTYIEKKGQLTFKEAVSIAIQVGRGIEAAHNKNIIHRDIKPQNIMISTEGKVKVMDFGIARAASSNTISSDVMGSVHYSSPEQARNGFVDGKSDIYSLGIVMYEMVTGRVPFDGDTTVAVAIQHLQEEMVKPSAYAPDLPISMEKIILKCTQKNPDRRYEDMSALLADLRKALISPNEDFVVMVPAVNQDKTRVIGAEDVNRIKQEASTVHLSEQLLQEEEMEDDELDDEDDDDGMLNPKMEKAITIMGIVTAIVIVGIIIYLIGSFFGLFKFGGSGNAESQHTETQTTETQQTEIKASESENSESEALTDENSVEMIDVKGKTYEEAQSALNAIGLGIKEEGTASSDEYEAGRILEQSVAVGERVELHTTIMVVTSSGSGSVEIPPVAGYDADTAEKTLAELGFLVSRQYSYSNDVLQGNVISQNPVSGSLGKKGDTVTITISQGKEPAVVPKVVGMTEEDAKAALTNVGLTGVTTASIYDSDAAAGYVISQSVDANTQLAAGSTVNLTVSLGPEPVEDVTTSTYKASFRVKKPTGDISNVSGANIYLYDGEEGSGNLLEQWKNQSIDSFGEEDEGLLLTKGGLLVSSGSVVIEWLDLDGNVIGEPQVKDITFNKEQ